MTPDEAATQTSDPTGGDAFGAVRPVRVALQQLAIPKYRLGLFNRLARRPNVDLRISYADLGYIDNVTEGLEVPHTQSRITRIPVLPGRTLVWNTPQVALATRRTCDVLILTWDLHHAGLVPGLLRARANGVRTILWGHGFSRSEAGWRSWPRRKVTALADAVVFYNHGLRQRHIDAGTPAQKCFVAINSLDQLPIRAARDAWASRPDDLEAWKRAHGYDGRPLVLFVSRFESVNRIDLLIDAAACLVRDGVADLKVALVGKGALEPELRAQVTRLGLDDVVDFPGAIYDEHALAPYFLTARAFCYPSSIGLSILHAFGYGLPVVTTGDLSKQMPEVESLSDGINGLFYRDGGVDDLVAKLRTLLDDDALRRRMGEAATRVVDETFTIDKMTDGFVRAIRYCQSLDGVT